MVCNFVTQHVLDLLNMESKKETLADRVIAAYKSSMETDRVGELEKELRTVSDRLNHVIDLLIDHKTDALLEKMDNLELQKSELEEQLYSARLAQKHIPSREEIIEWFAKLKSVEETKTSLQRQVIRTFVHKVYLWDEKAVIVLTLANTQETVAFEHIRDWEMLREETQEPPAEKPASGSCKSETGSPNIVKEETSPSKSRGITSDSSRQLKFTTNLSS